MTKAHDIEFAQQWIAKAEHDLVTARRMSVLPDVLTDVVCFHAQQAVEKAVKGALTAHGIEFERTHDLAKLLDQLAPILPALEMEEAAVLEMNEYAVRARYPGTIPDPSVAQAEKARETAERIVRLIGTHLEDLAKGKQKA